MHITTTLDKNHCFTSDRLVYRMLYNLPEILLGELYTLLAVKWWPFHRDRGICCFELGFRVSQITAKVGWAHCAGLSNQSTLCWAFYEKDKYTPYHFCNSSPIRRRTGIGMSNTQYSTASKTKSSSYRLSVSFTTLQWVKLIKSQILYYLSFCITKSYQTDYL